MVPDLHVVDVDVPLNNLIKDDNKLEQVALGREFHISLGRTVPIRVHQMDSMVTMLRQRLQSQRGSVFASHVCIVAYVIKILSYIIFKAFCFIYIYILF